MSGLSLRYHASRRIRLVAIGFLLILFLWVLRTALPAIAIPVVSLEYDTSPYNASKVALLIENRPSPILAPLMLHFVSVVPPDWRFRFMGSPESVAAINRSAAIQQQVFKGKLDLTYIPSNMSTAGQEMISRFLTTRWLYETVLQPAEWLLVFQTDSILCANSRQNLNDYLEYDWIGAPWFPDSQWGGNGGLSLRRVSRIVDVLRHQQRANDSEPEDVWLAERLGHHVDGKVANGTVSLTFSGEMNSGDPVRVNPAVLRSYSSVSEAIQNGEYVREADGWRDGFYEPMGYHTGGSGQWLHTPIWGTPEMRRHVWKYCPEVKMTLAMDAARYVPGNCNSRWKRGLGEESGPEHPFGTETIDGVEYPMLPPGLAPW